jgi:NAD(P)H-dependent FMN reductase
MTSPRQVLLIVGSPRGPEGVSFALADFLARKLAGLSVKTDSILITSPVHSEGRQAGFEEMADEADALALVFPLYADQLPASLVKFLEDYSLHRKNMARDKPQSLLVVVNNGFPEARQNDHAVAVVRKFAAQVGFEWLGALTLGGGGLVEPGKTLEESGGRAHRAVAALEAAALCLAGVWKGPLPEKVVENARKPVIPHWLYRFMGNWGFRRMAKKNGVLGRIKARPYVLEDLGPKKKGNG